MGRGVGPDAGAPLDRPGVLRGDPGPGVNALDMLEPRATDRGAGRRVAGQLEQGAGEGLDPSRIVIPGAPCGRPSSGNSENDPVSVMIVGTPDRNRSSSAPDDSPWVGGRRSVTPRSVAAIRARNSSSPGRAEKPDAVGQAERLGPGAGQAVVGLLTDDEEDGAAGPIGRAPRTRRWPRR